MEPLGSSSAILSTRCIGKKSVGRPTRSPSGWSTWCTKSSKEFRSMPRRVTPAVFSASSSPHTFSRGVCRLRMTTECNSTATSKRDFPQVGREAQPSFGQLLNGIGRHVFRNLAQDEPLGRHLHHGQFRNNEIRSEERRVGKECRDRC